jgi:hypothetical protein
MTLTIEGTYCPSSGEVYDFDRRGHVLFIIWELYDIDLRRHVLSIIWRDDGQYLPSHVKII